MIVLDTHAFIWWLAQPSRLSAAARRAIEQQRRKGPVSVSAMSVFEVTTLVRRGRLTLTMEVGEWLDAARSLPELEFVPITDDIAELAGSFGDRMQGDPADRVIAATALARRARLVSADERLAALPSLEVVW